MAFCRAIAGVPSRMLPIGPFQAAVARFHEKTAHLINVLAIRIVPGRFETATLHNADGLIRMPQHLNVLTNGNRKADGSDVILVVL